MSADYLIVGAGLFGSVMARCLAEGGKRVMVIDRRPHIGGNCYTELQDGVHVHRYGPHIFHTNNREVWDFVNRFATFNNYLHRALVRYGDRLFSFPFNLATFHQVWGVMTPQEAKRKLDLVRHPSPRAGNLRDWALSQVGEEIYEIFIRGYTTKQWNRDPKDLPASILKRIPVRLNWDDRYFSDTFQGIPIGGYTQLFHNMLDAPGISVQTGVDFFDHRRELSSRRLRVVYSGPIDRLFDYRFGELDYRSLRFEHERHQGDYQGAAVVNYTSADIPYTRIIEHKHFDDTGSSQSIVTREYPQAYGAGREPYYPIRDARNEQIYQRYRALAQAEDLILGGRLGSYRYFDMHQVVGQAMKTARQQLEMRETADVAA